MKLKTAKKNRRINFMRAGQTCTHCGLVIGQDYIPHHFNPKAGRFVCAAPETAKP